jgi:hypothetical protein
LSTTFGTLTRYRDMLLATARDRDLDLMRDIALRGARPAVAHPQWSLRELRAFIDRARSGLGGVSASGRMVAMSVDGKSGSLMILFNLVVRPAFLHIQREPSLSLSELPSVASAFHWDVIPW